MHIADVASGNLGANGIVGGGLPIAVGAALALKQQGKPQVVVCFFGDGANNDGLELTLTDDVLVRDLLADLNAKGVSSGLWGRNFRVDAVNSTKINGDLYARQFRIYLGMDHGLTNTSTIVLSRNSLINLGYNLPPADLTLIPPSFFIPVTLSMQVLKSGDNMINLNELAGVTNFNLYLNDSCGSPASDSPQLPRCYYC